MQLCKRTAVLKITKIQLKHSPFDPICRTAESPQNAPFSLHLDTEIEPERRKENDVVKKKKKWWKIETHKTRRKDPTFLGCFISTFYFLHPLLSSLCFLAPLLCISSPSVLSCPLFQLPSVLLSQSPSAFSWPHLSTNPIVFNLPNTDQIYVHWLERMELLTCTCMSVCQPATKLYFFYRFIELKLQCFFSLKNNKHNVLICNSITEIQFSFVFIFK